MINIPIVDDRFDLRVAGEWTKRNGYSSNDIQTPVDGRDLWSGRMTLGLKPTPNLQAYFVWEHFSEDDDRIRTGKQLCETPQAPTSDNCVPVPAPTLDFRAVGAGSINGQTISARAANPDHSIRRTRSKCRMASHCPTPLRWGRSRRECWVEPYAWTTQSRNLREIESTINPHYRAKNDSLS